MATDQPSAHSNRVLIVENDDHVLHSLEALVRSEGFDVGVTWSGREALALIESQPFDLILVDSYLPDIYLGEFIKLARRHATPTIIVMQSRKPLLASVKRSKMLGAFAVIDKQDLRQLRLLLAARHARSLSA